MTIYEAFDYTIRQMVGMGRKPKTIRNLVSARNSLLKSVPDIPIQLLTQDHTTQWKEEMLRRGDKTSSIARHISSLRVVLAEMEELRLDVLKPRKIDRIKVIRGRQEVITPREVQAMMNSARNSREKAMIALLFSLGCRPSEMLNLNREDVVRDGVTIANEKTGLDYPAFIAPYARDALNEYLETRRDRLRPLFISTQSRRLTLSRFEQILHEVADIAQQDFPEMWERDKIITPYTFRRGHGTDLFLNGANIVEVQEALGHVNIQNTRLYIDIPDDRHKEVRSRFHTQLK
jgi:integrase/recombinase XerD